jgi:large subunit ribosomal protein L4e
MFEINQNINVYGLDGTIIDKISIPPLISSITIRKDIIRRAFISAFTAKLQPKGRDPMAGKRTTAESFGVGLGLARVPRVKGERYPKASQAAFAPFTVGGRRCFPPVPEKILKEKINKKEKKLALISAIVASFNPVLVKLRGHVVEQVPQIPLVVDDEISSIKKASELRSIFMKLGLWLDIQRAKNSRKRLSGVARRRRKKIYRNAKSVLIVIDSDKGISKAARNFPGVDVCNVSNLNISLLAPGSHPGRLTVWSKSAFMKLPKLFGELFYE